jgi:hypothetical protein
MATYAIAAVMLPAANTKASKARPTTLEGYHELISIEVSVPSSEKLRYLASSGSHPPCWIPRTIERIKLYARVHELSLVLE